MAEVSSSSELLPSAVRVVPIAEPQVFGLRLGENHEIVFRLKSLETLQKACMLKEMHSSL